MLLTVIGATGGTGRELVRQALGAGHVVRAVARRPDDLPPQPGLTVVHSDPLEPSSLVGAVDGTHGVLSALGHRRGDDTSVQSRGAAAAIAAMSDTGVRRLVCVSAAPAGPPEEKGRIERWVVHPLLERVLGVYDDMRAMQGHLAASDMDWTVFRPPRLLDRPATGRYRTSVGRALPAGWTLPRADLADAMLRSLTDTTTYRQALLIAT